MTFRFAPWSRRGVGALPAAGGSDANSRRSVTATVRLSAERHDQPGVAFDAASAPLAVLGPGDVVGLNPAQVTRRVPKPDDHNLEPNYLAAIEFAHPDLPWLFSPVAAAGDAKADPWIMLVVIGVDGGAEQGSVAARAGSPNPVLTVADSAVLPPAAEAWAWAHVQIHPTNPDADGDVFNPVAISGLVRSRLIAPTHLQPGRSYVACVVPVYAAGREAGLGRPAVGLGTQPAWQAGTPAVLPVYDHWAFRTGPEGDFESLAKKLAPLTGFEGIGERTVAVEAVAGRLQGVDAPGGPMFPSRVRRVPTAIAQIASAGSLAPGDDNDAQAAVRLRLKALVDRTVQGVGGRPLVGPPLYGQWHAGVRSVDGEAGRDALAAAVGAQRWIEELNVDPDVRMTAGVGTEVVQHDQEALMSEAWGQLDAVMAANRRIRWAHLFSAAATHIHSRLEAVGQPQALRFAAPALARVRGDSGATVAAALDRSTVPAAVFDAAFARATRFAGGSAPQTRAAAVTALTAQSFRDSAPAVIPRRFVAAGIDTASATAVFARPEFAAQIRDSVGVEPAVYLANLAATTTVVANVAAGLQIDPAAPAVGGGAGGPALTVQVAAGSAAAVAVARAAGFARVQIGAGNVAASGHVEAEFEALAVADGALRLSVSALEVMNRAQLHAAVGERTVIDLSGDHVSFHANADAVAHLEQVFSAVGATTTAATAASQVAMLQSASLSALGLRDPSPWNAALSALSGDDTIIIKASGDFAAASIVAPSAPLGQPELTRFDMAAAVTVTATLKPEAAYGRLLAYAVGVGPLTAGVARRRDVFDPVMAAPQMPSPMVERLRVVDQNWVIGGADHLPPNSICLLEVNRHFVESFLVGANHEMARELLWRGFPTDLRGSCFRRFWPVPFGATRDFDVKELHTWVDPLGANGPDGFADEALAVVVVKGDLLRRYPGTIITAERGTATLGANETFVRDGDAASFAGEAFRGQLEPDITYVALRVDADTLRGVPDGPGGLHGWYISLAQPVDEPRFGLDDNPGAAPASNPVGRPDSWSWQGLAGGDQVAFLSPGDVVAADNAAVVARNLFQKPFRLLLRAHDYIPAQRDR